MTHGVLYFAHRGFSSRYPENTMLAFRKALEAHCDGIELDVHLCKDGEPVIIHDEDAARTTGVSGQIRDMTLADLRRLDAGQGQAVPTLEEYLALAAAHPIVTNIELKNDRVPYAGLEEKTLDLVRRYGLEARVIFSSFNHDAVIKCKALAPEIPCGFLTDAPIADPGAYLKKHDVEYLHPKYEILRGAFWEEILRDNVPLHVWTVDDEAGMRDLMDKGVRGIITNNPLLPHEMKAG
jgi:glycerophosphoryl diester phosphodiesterase